MKAILLSIGDEILAGNTLDTNSNFIATKLREIGIAVEQIFTISDEVEHIKQALSAGFQKANLIIATGGLGPTNDDKTKKAFAEYFQDDLVFDELTFQHLEKLLTKRNRQNLIDINREQAVILSSSRVFQNEFGTAPCLMLEKDQKIAFCLPGVPYEVKPLIKDKIIPFLQAKFSLPHIVTRIISVVDIPESLLAKTIETWENALPENVSLSYLPVGNRIKLRLTAMGTDRSAVENTLDFLSEQLKPIIGKNVISWFGNEIPEILKQILIRENLTIATAESCTGGEIARQITSVPGLSSYFVGGVIPYQIAQKVKILGVSEQTLLEKTVVSAEVAKEMSLGCQKMFGADIAISSTGVSGPDPDEFFNEVGTVFYSIRVKNYEKTNKLFLPHLERNDFAAFVSQRILQDVVQLICLQDFQ